VQEAAREIQTGVRINCDLPLTVPEHPLFGRKKFEQKKILKTPRVVFDDEWHFNSQGSSQWDGLRHYAHQETGEFYGGVRAKEILNPDEARRKDALGIGAWSKVRISQMAATVHLKCVFCSWMTDTGWYCRPRDSS
jgi:hypothetical protein